MEKRSKTRRFGAVLVRLVLCVAVLGSGYYAMAFFSSKKAAPHKGRVKERVLQVDVKEARARSVETRLKGFGVVQPVTRVSISSEVAGRIIYIHPDLEQGKQIAKGEVLFRIDPMDFEAAVKRLEALLLQRESELNRIRREYKADQGRLKTKKRNMALARDEYERVRILLEKNRIGNRSEKDQAEQAMNTAIDAYDQMKRALSLYPFQIKAAQAIVASVRADLEKARAELSRCMVASPFDARVTAVAMEWGEYASPGKEVVALADDARLEIPVSLDAGEAVAWLYFQSGGNGGSAGWFGKPVPKVCEIRWLEDESRVFKGILDRVSDFDRESRTLTVMVAVDPADDGCENCPPLVEGMFCKVSIPGKPLADVYAMKRWAVSTDDTVYIAEEGRLKTVGVNRVYAMGDDLFLTGDIREGDLLITTRLVDPLENSVLKIMNRN